MEHENNLLFYNSYLNMRPHENVDIIVFYNCSTRLKNLFSTCDFLISFTTNGDHIIIYEYNKSRFTTPDLFYYNIINWAYPENNDSFSYSFKNNIETYHIIHNNTYAELLIYHDDIMIGLDTDSVEFNINGTYVRIPDNITEFNKPLIVYKFITNYIDGDTSNDIIIDCENSSECDTIVDYNMF